MAEALQISFAHAGITYSGTAVIWNEEDAADNTQHFYVVLKGEFEGMISHMQLGWKLAGFGSQLFADSLGKAIE
ncbi:hypothetical protein [Foetidibacter luteolus]|uniref:hypothetical protein n=1 Tax=Foetidibacter luteolus TaxID=2608880 RepID=UPI00129BD7D1|nr:hypothetical protein [Foetidibacter luteolus]